MLPEELNDVTTSYHRCMHGVGFTNTFYRRFLAKSPMIAEKFRHTDFDHQKLMLRESLLVMIMFNSNSSAGMDELEQLAERHSRRGVDIPPHLYELWLDALCESVATHDSELTVALERQWRQTMQAGIDFIVARY